MPTGRQNIAKGRQLQKNRFRKRFKQARAFTLPEVIVSFSVLAMVVTSAAGLLTVVIRTNADNVNSLVANGLAQEGLESVRFMRDSNALLGLDFDGTKGTVKSQSIWGAEWAATNVLGPSSYYLLLSNFEPQVNCGVNNLADCLPVSLKSVDITDDIWTEFNVISLEQLANAGARVYLREQNNEQNGGQGSGGNGAFRYMQIGPNDSQPADARPTQYSRLIRLEPLQSTDEPDAVVDVLRVSSIVTWADANGRPRKVVLTSDLTDWK